MLLLTSGPLKLFRLPGRRCYAMSQSPEVLPGKTPILCKRHAQVRTPPSPLPLPSLTLLRVNVKLGGVNAVPEARSVPMLSDPQNPAVIIGADVIHPAPGVENKPSFTSMVANIDPTYSRYIAISKVQKSRQEIIDDTEEMVKVGCNFKCTGGLLIKFLMTDASCLALHSHACQLQTRNRR